MSWLRIAIYSEKTFQLVVEVVVDVVDVEVVDDDDVELVVVVEEVVLVDVVVDVVVVTSLHSHTYVACHLLLPHLLSPTQVPPVHLKNAKNYYSPQL